MVNYQNLTCNLADEPMIALSVAIQIGVGLALLGRGLTAPHSLPARVLLVALGIFVLFMRADLLAVS